MPEQSDKPLVGKTHLYLFALIAAGAVLNLLFNPEARRLVGLEKWKGLSFSFLSRGRQPAAAEKVKPPAFSAEELTAFTQSFTQREVKDIYIPPPPPPPPPKVDPKEEQRGKDAELAEKKKREEEEARRKLAYLWPVCVQGSYRDLQGRWTAIVSGYTVRAGDNLVSGKDGFCRYSLLSVGQRCAWLQVHAPGEAASELPEIEWPDVELIELRDAGGGSRNYRPDSVRLGSGHKLKVNDVIEYRSTGARFIVKQLWLSGVVFEAVKSKTRVQIACSLVTQ